jgi:hypothetical protein
LIYFQDSEAALAKVKLLGDHGARIDFAWRDGIGTRHLDMPVGYLHVLRQDVPFEQAGRPGIANSKPHQHHPITGLEAPLSGVFF